MRDLAPGEWWWIWYYSAHDQKKGLRNPYKYFVEKFGFQPAVVCVGASVVLDVPEPTELRVLKSLPTRYVKISVWPVEDTEK